MRRRHVPTLLAAIAVVGLLAAPAAHADDEKKKDEKAAQPSLKLTKVEAASTPAGEVYFEIEGTVELPAGAKVTVRFELEKSAVAKTEAPVRENQFRTRFEPRGKVLPGVYAVVAAFDRRSQNRRVLSKLPEDLDPGTDRRPVRVGTAEEETIERGKVRGKYVELVGYLHEVHRYLLQWGSFLTTAAKWKRVELMLDKKGKAKGEPLPARDVRELLDQWNAFRERYWESTYRTVQHDDSEFRKYVFGTYYPEVDRQLDALYLLMEKMFRFFGRELHIHLGEPVPKEYQYREVFKFSRLYEESLAIAARLYELLDEEPVAWRLIDLSRPERAKDVHDDLFRSTLSKFEIRKPGADWFFDLASSSPSVRLRIRNDDPALREVIAMGVELHDYPTAEDYDHLARLRETALVGAFPGFRLIKSERIEVDDPTMPDGKRPGLDVRFQMMHREMKFEMRAYCLFCRFHKRTYDVVTFVSKDRWKDYEDVVQQVVETFKVLDDPNMKHVPSPDEDEEAPPPEGSPGEGGR